MPINAFQDHTIEHMKRLAKKVGPVYFLLPTYGSESIKAYEIFSEEEMKHAAIWYSKKINGRQ